MRLIVLICALVVSEMANAMEPDALGKMKTWCAGRVRFELPERFIPVESYGTVQGVTIENLGRGSADQLNDLVMKRLSDLRSGSVQQDGIGLIYKDHARLGGVTILAFQQDVSVLGITPEEWSEEAYALRQGHIFRLTHVTAGEAGDRDLLVRFAEAVAPRAEGEIPPGTGACLPDAFLAVPPESEAHGMTFTLNGEQTPLGITVELATRRAGDLPLDIEGAMPSGPMARDVRIAGLTGRAVSETIGEVGFGAVAGRVASGQNPAAMIRLEYFDEREGSGAPPVDSDTATAIWRSLLSGMQLKG